MDYIIDFKPTIIKNINKERKDIIIAFLLVIIVLGIFMIIF